MAAILHDDDRNDAAQIVALFSVLVHAWLTSNFDEAGKASAELLRLGVSVKLGRRNTKAVKHG
jgi:hypothetical protein